MSRSTINFFSLRILLFCILTGFAIPLAALAEDERPNVIVIMSDDQGGGDYGFQGNPLIETPSLDTMFKNGGCLTNFYVSPVCAPTRASLMTGRYNYRTRCIDTYIGRAMMDSDEKTLAEYLQDAGYRTGIYGKWHLGDNYPLRANDQGFQDSLVHRGGGIGQPSDPIGAEGKYTDPTLIKNGIETPMKGYCTDLYFDAAMEFIDRSVNERKNFFTYIATNAPHGPFHDVPEALYEKYRQVDFSPILINKLNEKRLEKENDKLARIAAMITNIDVNVGRLIEHLESLGVLENTIVIYLNDNGPNSMRFVGNMRGMKTHVDDGGIRSPLLFHWPAKVKSGHRSNLMCAHIDVLPTLLDACSIQSDKTHPVDGRSFLPLLVNARPEWPNRSLVFQTHRGDKPQLYHHFALHNGPWKLVHPSGFGKEKHDGEVKLELYNLKQDPQQQNNVAASKPKVLARLKENYESWFKDVSSTRPDNYAPPRIVIGTDHESKTVLTRQDWRHSQGKPWARDSNGSWLLEAEKPTSYELEIIFNQLPTKGKALIQIGDVSQTIEISAGQKRGHTHLVKIPQGKTSLSVTADFNGQKQGPHQVILTRQ
jgi:arylsulfatase/arylsulfatase A